jgi:hypothetical protein
MMVKSCHFGLLINIMSSKAYNSYFGFACSVWYSLINQISKCTSNIILNVIISFHYMLISDPNIKAFNHLCVSSTHSYYDFVIKGAELLYL